MIDGVGNKGVGSIGIQKGQVARAGASARADDALGKGQVSSPGSLISDLAAGPPIDAEKIAALRAAIAEGRCPVDPEKIAERMMALDLPYRDEK